MHMYVHNWIATVTTDRGDGTVPDVAASSPIEYSPPWEASSRIVSEEICWLLWNLNSH
jgi:hypothetical protein